MLLRYHGVHTHRHTYIDTSVHTLSPQCRGRHLIIHILGSSEILRPQSDWGSMNEEWPPRDVIIGTVLQLRLGRVQRHPKSITATGTRLITTLLSSHLFLLLFHGGDEGVRWWLCMGGDCGAVDFEGSNLGRGDSDCWAVNLKGGDLRQGCGYMRGDQWAMVALSTWGNKGQSGPTTGGMGVE